MQRTTAVRVLSIISSFTLALGACGDDDASDNGTDGSVAVDGSVLPDGAAPPDGQVVDDASAPGSELAGLWTLRTMTFPAASGAGLTTVSSETDPPSLRGGMIVSATGSDALNLEITFMFLESGVPGEAPFTDELPVAIESSDIALIGENDVSAFRYVVNGNELALSVDETDPRNASLGNETPRMIVAERADATSSTIMGSWNLTSLTQGGTTLTSDTCVPGDDPGEWNQTDLTLEFDEIFRFEIEGEQRNFSDDACTTQTGTEPSRSIGFSDDDGTTMRIWMVDEESPNDSGLYLEYDYTVDGSELTASFNTCLPVGGCEAEAPTQLVLTRR